MLIPILFVVAIVGGLTVAFAVGFVFWVARQQRDLMEEREAEANHEAQVATKIDTGDESNGAGSSMSRDDQVRVFAYDGNLAPH